MFLQAEDNKHNKYTVAFLKDNYSVPSSGCTTLEFLDERHKIPSQLHFFSATSTAFSSNEDGSAFASTARTRSIDQTIRPGVYHRDYPRRLIEASVYAEVAFIRGNTVH